jgi:spore maturation protein CgeB
MAKILIVGIISSWSIEKSYITSLKSLGHQVDTFDIVQSEIRYIKLNKFGRVLNNFIPIEAWIRKSNKDLFVCVKNIEPDFVIVFGQSRVSTGFIAQSKISFPGIKFLFFWPDPLLNLTPNLINNLKLYDIVFSYSRDSIPVFEALGAKNVKWLPFAGDVDLHGSPIFKREYECDLSFIGMWRPEREEIIYKIIQALPMLNVKIWGPDWERSKYYKHLRKIHQKKDLRGSDFADAIYSSTISLNIMDVTNYPAANMRFFEIPCSGGLQLTTYCPEMADLFIDGESIKYFKSPEDLPKIIDSLLTNHEQRIKIINNSKELILNEHNYTKRALAILESIK